MAKITQRLLIIFYEGFRGCPRESPECRSEEVLPRGWPTICDTVQMLIAGQDLKREFITELIYPAIQANAIYEVSLSPSQKCRSSYLINGHWLERVPSRDFISATCHRSRDD
jgi:hypothetical protein